MDLLFCGEFCANVSWGCSDWLCEVSSLSERSVFDIWREVDAGAVAGILLLGLASIRVRCPAFTLFIFVETMSQLSIVIGVMCFFCLLVGCHTPPHSAWTKEKVLSAAYDTLRVRKLRPENFEKPDVGYLAEKHAWCVTFWPKSRIIGADISLAIYEDTGRVHVLPAY